MRETGLKEDRLLYPEAVSRAREHLERGQKDWAYLSAIVGTGPIAEFETTFGRTCGGGYAVALSNCTSALFVALLSAGVGPGDEVILPSYTWPQTLTPVLMAGATPVFADIAERSVTVDPESIERLVSSKTKAVICAHLHGIPCDVRSIARIARKANICLIYDAAQGFGSLVDERPIGAYGDFAAFSFGRSKLFSIGEGGVLICRTRSLYERAVGVSQHPVRMHREIDDEKARNAIDGVAMNFRMHPLIASLALGQLEGFLRAKANSQAQARFRKTLRVLQSLGVGEFLPRIPKGSRPSGTAIPLLLRRDGGLGPILDVLEKHGLQRLGGGLTTPLHLTPTIQNHRLFFHTEQHVRTVPSHESHERGSCPNSEEFCRVPQILVKTA